MRSMAVIMSHGLGHKNCRVKIFVMFCHLDGRDGSLSCFPDVEPGLSNFSKYIAMQQQPNIRTISVPEF